MTTVFGAVGVVNGASVAAIQLAILLDGAAINGTRTFRACALLMSHGESPLLKPEV